MILEDKNKNLDIPLKFTIGGSGWQNAFFKDQNNTFYTIPLLYADKYDCYYFDNLTEEMWKINTEYLSDLYNSPAKEFTLDNGQDILYDDEDEGGIFPLKDINELRINNIDLEYFDQNLDFFTEAYDINSFVDYIKNAKTTNSYLTTYENLDETLSEITKVFQKQEGEIEL